MRSVMDQALGDLPGITRAAGAAERTHVYYQYCVYGPQRDELVVRCVRRGIDIETLHVDVCSDWISSPARRARTAGAPGARRAAGAMQVPVYSTLTDEPGRARGACRPRCSPASDTSDVASDLP